MLALIVYGVRVGLHPKFHYQQCAFQSNHNASHLRIDAMQPTMPIGWVKHFDVADDVLSGL